MNFSIQWLGHSAFAFDIDGHSVLVDPFLTGNPLAAANPEDLSPEVILVSHAHGDHTADVVPIAKRTGALVVCNFEMGNYFLAKGVENVFQVNPGGSYYGDFFNAKWTVAFHSSSFPDGTYGGQPNGFIVQASGKRVYFAGDTSLFGDMKLIGEESIDVAMLPIGDVFTMGVEDSIKAIKMLRPKYVIPMHYNTFTPIVQNGGQWAQMVNHETDAQPIVMDPGDTFNVE
ncbi:MAG: metal-dependent hydrolase [Anaerolineae bacterium]|nr:metal-dependent hydrolase [Anaerolineae bacterium]MCA9888058.1 metal-dependent hydrolase [Anaerolineae bacterium]